MADGAYSQEMRSLKKGTWSPDEDKKLIAYVSRYGNWNWNEMPKFAGILRSGKSCRLRWMNYLRPNIKRGNFTKEEDEIILKLHQAIGCRWSKIAACLPGRTDNEIKNHWHARLKKQKEQPIQTLHKTKSSSRGANKRSVNESTTLRVTAEKACILESSSISFSITESNHEATESMGMMENTGSSERLLDLDEKISADEDCFLENSNTSYSSTGTNHGIGELLGIREETSSYDPMVELHDSFWPQPFLVEPFETSHYYPDYMVQSYQGMIEEPKSPLGLFSDEHTNCWFNIFMKTGSGFI